jgi:hypothetical protein
VNRTASLRRTATVVPHGHSILGRLVVMAIDRAVADGDRGSTMLAVRAWVGVAAVKYGVAGSGTRPTTTCHSVTVTRTVVRRIDSRSRPY